jgi:hypothetical protein
MTYIHQTEEAVGKLGSWCKRPNFVNSRFPTQECHSGNVLTFGTNDEIITVVERFVVFSQAVASFSLFFRIHSSFIL